MYTGIIAVLMGITIFGFNVSKSVLAECKQSHESWGLNTPFVQHLVQQLNNSNSSAMDKLKFSVHGDFVRSFSSSGFDEMDQNKPDSWNHIFGRIINKRLLISANTIDELVQHYPTSLIKEYDNVWIKSSLKEKNISLMSESHELSLEQKSLFKHATIGESFEIVINYHITNPKTQEVQFERLNVGLTIVPEQEAEYTEGYNEMIAYFEEKSLEIYYGKNLDNFTSVGLRFTITEDGQAEEIHKTRDSGYEEIDRYIIKLIENMPPWTPAKDANGNMVKQEFELVYGTPGC